MKRIVVDTNVLVRLFARDDGGQWEVVQRLVTENTWVILPTVVLETEWVLRSRFRFAKEHILQLFQDLVAADGIEVQQRKSVVAAIDAYAAGMDFADALHVACLEEGSTFVTFDADLTKRAKQQFNHLVIELVQQKNG
jgi:predicted nucleic-acid-binding protein